MKEYKGMHWREEKDPSRWTVPYLPIDPTDVGRNYDADVIRINSPFFIEAVPLGVAKDGSLAALLEHMGLGRENLMACGDGLNDRSMIEYAGVGVAMQNAEEPVKAVADYVTAADNDHDGVAEKSTIPNIVLATAVDM